MAALLVVDGQDVEEERLHVIVEGLVVQEQLGQEAQVLAVDLTDVTVHLKHRQVSLPIDLTGRWMIAATLHLRERERLQSINQSIVWHIMPGFCHL